MNIVKIIYKDGLYDSEGATNFEMDVLGQFLARGLYCCKESSLRDWALAGKKDPNSEFAYTNGSDTTCFEEGKDKNDFIYITMDKDGFIYIAMGHEHEMSELDNLKMSRQQFLRLVDDWHEKVCKSKAKTVIVKHEDGQFVIETKD